jgi:hypothetical protein
MQPQRDLAYVDELLEASRKDLTPRGVYLVWAVIGAVGFVLVDFAHGWLNVYWLAAAPLGSATSCAMAIRHGRKRGQAGSSAGKRQALQWFGLLVSLGLASLLVFMDHLSWEGFGELTLLLVALGFWQSGIYLERKFLWIGLGTGAAFVVLVSSDFRYEWTCLGLVWAAALGLAGLVREGARASQRQ